MKKRTFSLALIAIVLAIIVVFNILVSMLPASLTQLDISSSKLYSITSNTKVVVNALEKDVDIYWISQAGKEDTVIEKLLSKYDSLSKHLNVTKKNPDIYPTFAQQYTDGDVSNNDIIVKCGDRYRYIKYADLYDVSSAYESSFNGEGEITSAIGYVTNDDLPKIYVINGHNEAEISDVVSKAIFKANMEIEEFSLLNVDKVPEEADCVLIYQPQTDYSDKEVELLKSYIADGGKLMVVAGLSKDATLTNLESLLNDYNIKPVEGVIVEGNRSNYAFGMPYVLLPNIEDSDITSPLVENKSYIIAPIAKGYQISSSATTLLTTSEEAYSKVDGLDLTTYEKEDKDIDGPFTIAFSIENKSKDSRIVWVGSSYMFEDLYDSYSSGANTDFLMNSLSWLSGEEQPISIRAKSMNNEYLAINENQASYLRIVLLVAVPMCFVLMGIFAVIDRRKFR